MIKHVYANGDSCVFGQGLDPKENYLYEFSDVKRQNCWAGKITARLGLIPAYDLTMDALPGGSNDRIFRTTVNSVLKLLERFDPSEILVIVGFSDVLRTEFFYEPFKRYIPFLPHCPPGKNDPRDLKQLHDLWIASSVEEMAAANRFMTGYLQLQSFLEGLGIKYISTTSINLFAHTKEMDIRESLTTMPESVFYKHIKWENFLHTDHFMSYNSTFKDHVLTPCHHPDKIGHARWATHVFDFLNKRYELVK